MDRRTVLRNSLAFTLPLTAGCLGNTSSSADDAGEEESAIDLNETYGGDREGTIHQFQTDQQMELAFGDGVTDGAITFLADRIEWGSSERNPDVHVYFALYNESNSTFTSYPRSRFSLYEDGTSNEMTELYSMGDDAYSGSNQLQPGTSEEGYLSYGVSEEYETLREFRFALYALDGNVDLAWTVQDET